MEAPFEVTLKTKFEKSFFLFIKHKLMNWRYNDMVEDWGKEKVNKALISYKHAVLTMVTGLVSGSIERKGLFRSLHHLQVYDIFQEVKKIKNENLLDPPEKLKELVDLYLRFVYPVERKILTAFSAENLLSDIGTLENQKGVVDFFLSQRITDYVTAPEQGQENAAAEDPGTEEETGAKLPDDFDQPGELDKKQSKALSGLLGDDSMRPDTGE